MNFDHIIAHAGFTFFSSLAALNIAGVPSLKAAFLVAAVQGGLAFFAEFQKETDATPPITPNTIGKQGFIKLLGVFA